MLSVPLDEVVTPGLVMRVEGEGLPLPVPGGQLKVGGGLATFGWANAGNKTLSVVAGLSKSTEMLRAAL